MRKLFFLGCLTAFALFAQDRPPLEKLESLSGKLQSHEMWQARYDQEYIPAGMDLGEEVSGSLWLAWPDRLLFIQEEPEKRSMGFEGRKLRLVDPGAGSCDEHLLTEEEWERIPLVAILDTGQAVRQFSILDQEGVITLLPHEKGGVDRVELKIGSDGLPRELIITDPQGATSRFNFSKWKPAMEIPGGKWLPDPPEGIECVGDPA